MAWITITKRWDRKVNDLQTARYLPGRHNVTAAVAREAKEAGVVEPEGAEEENRHILLGRAIAAAGKRIHGQDDG
ncbi:hypothetical protein [Sphingobium yanoikuyae]|nr:hypothetical protein [Sphingobium yanoikuyae]